METTMTGVQRRKKILEMLGQSSTPLSGGALGRAVGVSRQVVVQDIALLRTDRYTQHQPKRQAFHQLAHTHFSFLIPISSFLLFPKFFRIQTAVLHPLDRVCHHLLIFLVGHAVPAVHAL